MELLLFDAPERELLLKAEDGKPRALCLSRKEAEGLQVRDKERCREEGCILLFLLRDIKQGELSLGEGSTVRVLGGGDDKEGTLPFGERKGYAKERPPLSKALRVGERDNAYRAAGLQDLFCPPEQGLCLLPVPCQRLGRGGGCRFLLL